MTRPRLRPDAVPTDPGLQAEWDAARDYLAAILKPWLPPAVISDLVTAYVTGYMAGAGWRPPTQPPPDWLLRALLPSGDAA